MNRVYKVIWSKAKHCYVVTSEIARSVTKSASSARSAGRKGAAVLAMAALLFTAGGVLGEAADQANLKIDEHGVVTMVKDDSNQDVNKLVLKVDGDNQITMDKDGIQVGKNNIVIGSNGTIKGANERFSVGADGKVTAASGNIGTVDITSTGAVSGVTDLTVSGNVEAVGNLTVGNGNFTVNGITGNVTTGYATIGGYLTVEGDTEMKGDLGVTGNLSVEGVFAGGDTADAAKAALNANGSIKGADGKFTVDADGNVATNGGNINAGSGTITGNKLTDGVASLQAGNLNVHDITATGSITGTSLNTQGGTISGGAITGTTITGTSLNTKGGDISGGDIKSSGTIHADGKITGNGLDAGSGGAINGGSLSVTGAMEGNSLTLKGGDLDAGSGTITTKGNIKADGTITTNNLAVTGGLETDHITLGSEPLNYTKIDKGNVTSKILATDGGVIPIAESIFNKDGSSITVRTNEGSVDSTGNSTVGGKEIIQYLGNNAVPDVKNVTRRMVRYDDGTFSMVDTAVDGKDKYSIVSQNAGERKVTVVEGTKNLNVTENLTNGIVSETYDGAKNKVTLTQGMDGTYKVETSGTSTEDIDGQKIENYNGGLDTNITGNETHDVSGTMTTTVTGKSSLSAADIENKASSSIWNHVGEGENTSWKMTNGTVVESVKDASGKINQTTTTAADTYQFVKDGDNTLAKRTSSTNDNLNITDGPNTYTKITTATGNKQTVTDGTETASTNLTKAASNTLIENGTQSVLDHMAADTSYTVMNENGNGSRRQQTASEILDRVTDGTDTSEVKQTASEVAASAKDISNTATDKITSQIGDGSAVKSEMTAKGITNTAKGKAITNEAKTLLNKASESITDKVGDNVERTMTTKQIQDKVGKTTVTTTDGLTELTNKDHSHKTVMDYANVTKDLNVNGDATVDKKLTVKGDSDLQGDATVGKNLEVKGTSTLKGDVTMESNATVKKDLTVNGKSTFNDKVTITNNGLAVTGGTTTDALTVTGTSEFRGKADFKDNVSMGNDLAVKGETKTGTLHVEKDGYVGGNLNVAGNIETHDAELSETSRQVVTGRQLYQTNERVDRLDNRIKKVGANAAALAALRPGDFNPDDKFSIAAGFGSYRNANAAALGLFYRPNENVLLSLGTSFGDGENMVNAGVSVKFGRGKSMAERRKEMADEVSSMRDEMRSQDERIAELEEMLKKQSELIEKLSKES